ncbi:hypothetical protein F52700_8495 [Fusarium sp. NRRL 52700]|nr:hypothetical protein F52700_8495 [Fusarium sp. NRRL 52700]
MQLNWVFLLVASLASLAACKEVGFINPPPWDLVDDGLAREFDNNRRYRHGETVQAIISKNPLYNLNVTVWQLDTANNKATKQGKLIETKKVLQYHWSAEYDMANYTKNGEDAVYWFEMSGLASFARKITLRSTIFNVSRPDSFDRDPFAASKTTSLVRESPTAQSKATNEPSREKEKASKRSGLTTPAVVGITIGACVAFALTILGFCWGFERIRVAKQLQKSHEFELRNMERDVHALRDTVSKLGGA